LDGGQSYLIYYISVLPIPNDDKLNPIVYKVKGIPDSLDESEFDAAMDEEDKRMLSEMTTIYN